MIRVAVTGALGRMGSEVCAAVLADPELELAGMVDASAHGGPSRAEFPELVLDGVELLDERAVDVLVDFTNADAAPANVRWALGHGIHCVVGTTGVPDAELDAWKQLCVSGGANVIMAANFALGAVLMMRFAELAGAVFDQCEIIELHHRGKLDAPSGTALTTAERVNRAMQAAAVPPSREQDVQGARGATVGDVQVHSVRLEGLVAHQEVLFGSRGETLSIRHDTTDRTCFMPGVLLAVKAVGDTPGLTIGIEKLLGLA